MSRQTEQRLIQRAARGDRDAAEALIGAHEGGLYAFILRLSGRSDVAEDVVQDAFVRALTHLDRFDIRFRFSTWLFTIARRLYINRCDRKSPLTGAAFEAGSESRGAPSDERTGERADVVAVRDCLQAALMRLPREQREVVVLFHQHGWSIALVAEQLEMPEGTVKSHLHRGRNKLREILERDPMVRGGGVVPESWLRSEVQA